MPTTLAAKPELLLRIAGSRAVDGEGRPLILHHGTDAAFESFGLSRDLGTHFGSRAQAERRIRDLHSERKIRRPGTRERVISAIVRAANPLFLPDDPIAWPAGYLVSLFRRFIPDRAMPRVARLIESGERGQGETKAFVKSRLREAGYDSIVYRNVVESPGRGRSVDWSWCIFEPAQILIVGENVMADVMEVPADFERRFEPFPLPSNSRSIPGLRRRNGNIAYKADATKFESAVLELLISTGGERLSDGYCCVRISIPLSDGSSIIAEVIRDIGRVVLSPDNENPYEAMSRVDVCDDNGPVKKGFTCGLSFEWQPGEDISDTLERVERALAAWRSSVEVAPAARMTA
jgi:hypothetical protein